MQEPLVSADSREALLRGCASGHVRQCVSASVSGHVSADSREASARPDSDRISDSETVVTFAPQGSARLRREHGPADSETPTRRLSRRPPGPARAPSAPPRRCGLRGGRRGDRSGARLDGSAIGSRRSLSSMDQQSGALIRVGRPDPSRGS